VTVTDANNCSASASVSVTVNPLPVASITPSGPTIFCQGGNVTLTANGGNSYLWSTSSTTQSINVASSGNYSVMVTDVNNCSSSTSQNVIVNPNPFAPNIIQVADSLISDVANAYQWYYNSVLISGANSQSYHPTQNGNYSVVITDANNCTASSTGYPFIMTGTLDAEHQNQVTIYPNPSKGIFTIQTNNKIEKEITVTDLLGNIILKSETQSRGLGTKSEIDLSSQSKGIYLVKVMMDGKTTVKKIVLLP
jgi:hypothetical protein